MICLNEASEHDGANRQTEVQGPSGNVKESWTLDGMGNSQSANAANEITAPGYQYDKAGNMTADGTNTYKYDAWNELVEVDQGLVVAQYRYDGGRRRFLSTQQHRHGISDGTFGSTTPHLGSYADL